MMRKFLGHTVVFELHLEYEHLSEEIGNETPWSQFCFRENIPVY